MLNLSKVLCQKIAILEWFLLGHQNKYDTNVFANILINSAITYPSIPQPVPFPCSIKNGDIKC